MSLSFVLFRRALLTLLALGWVGAWSQPPPPAKAVADKAVARASLPARNMTVELRVVAEAALTSGGQQSWSSAAVQDEDWQKVVVANGEKARFEFSAAQAWAWTGAAVRGNGAGSVDGVTQSLQWAQDVRGLECQVAWAGGKKPAKLDVSVQSLTGGKGLVDGVLPQPRQHKVQTVVWVPLGDWFTLARSGPRPQLPLDGSYSSRTADTPEVRLLQVRVLAPD